MMSGWWFLLVPLPGLINLTRAARYGEEEERAAGVLVGECVVAIVLYLISR